SLSPVHSGVGFRCGKRAKGWQRRADFRRAPAIEGGGALLTTFSQAAHYFVPPLVYLYPRPHVLVVNWTNHEPEKNSPESRRARHCLHCPTGDCCAAQPSLPGRRLKSGNSV